MRPNFTQCADTFKAHANDTLANLTYTGTVRGIFGYQECPKLITLAGCRELCGTGNAYYTWVDSSATITTWVLPIVGLLLQAPYESNELLRTFYALARWIGSPIASLSYILWNVKVNGKCALLVDMATRYGDVPDEDSEFAQIRDSLYILSVMNQYSIKRKMPAVEAEKLMRIALFSDSLQLAFVEDDTQSLVKRRRKLARSLRAGRKKGVVPVFISLLWFLFSLAISIQQAYGHLGENSTAHRLALGLLLAWLPVLILSSIVDRNPVATEDIRSKLNRLIDAVRVALLNPGLRDTYMRETQRTPPDFAWTQSLSDDDYFHDGFFTRFAGQGRVRWHYGCANSILAGIEDAFVTAEGRDWLWDAERARTHMVKGPTVISGLRWFDFRESWQIISSIIIVGGSAGGAFTLSYWTPTVGLGCRSGGYMIFMVIALGTFGLEMLCWWLIAEGTISSEDALSRIGTHIERRLPRTRRNRWMVPVRRKLHRVLSWWAGINTRDRIEMLVLRPCEVINSAWLAYIVLAQTFGSYQNCKCLASTWGGGGGHIDFESSDYYRAHGVVYYWSVGTSLSTSVMFVSMVFIVIEWCTQSHLSTENYENASQGLRRTRAFKKYTFWIITIPDPIITAAKHFRYRVLGGKTRPGRRSLRWSSETRHRSIPLVSVNGHDPSDGQSRDKQKALLHTGRDGNHKSTLLPSPPRTHSRSPRSSFGEASPMIR
ncbi:hypothetical protein MMC24_001889 [Lignoscripta atroalba]|nr:hypothetical protein [Lignoscripta atroalba]